VSVPRAEERPTLTVREAANALGVSGATAYRSIQDGTFPVATVRVGSRVAVCTSDLRRVLHLNDPPASNGNGNPNTTDAGPTDRTRRRHFDPRRH